MKRTSVASLGVFLLLVAGLLWPQPTTGAAAVTPTPGCWLPVADLVITGNQAVCTLTYQGLLPQGQLTTQTVSVNGVATRQLLAGTHEIVCVQTVTQTLHVSAGDSVQVVLP